MEEKKTVKKAKKSKKFIFFIIIIVALFARYYLTDGKDLDFISKLLQENTVIEKQLFIKEVYEDEYVRDINLSSKDILVSWADNNIKFMRLSGDVINDREILLERSKLYHGEDAEYIFSKGRGTIYVLGKKGKETARVAVDDDLVEFKECRGLLSWLYKEADGEGLKFIFPDGIDVARIFFKEKHIGVWTVSENVEFIAVSTMQFQNDKVDTEIIVHNIEGEKLFSHQLKNEMLYSLEYSPKGRLLALTNKKIYCFDGEEILWEHPLEKFMDICTNEDDFVVLEESKVSCYDYDYNYKWSLNLAANYNKILRYRREYILYGENGFIIVDEGEHNFSFTEDIRKLVTNGRDIIILKNDAIYHYEVKKTLK